MRRLLAFALVLLPALPALAAGRTFSIATVIKNGTTPLHAGETSVTVKANRNIKVSQQIGSSNVYVPIPGRLNAAGTSRLYTATTGVYFASPESVLFSIK